MNQMKKLPPQMGWSTWNQYRQNISEELILNTAKQMKALGLLEAGYQYINLDDCWQQSQRDADLQLQFDYGRFPSGAGIVKKLNDLGFKAGIYSSSGHYTCEDMPGSYGYELIDAKTFADWGFEYLKYDYCHVVDLPTDPHYQLKGFATETPPILYLAAHLEKEKEETCLLAEVATLTGAAKMIDQAITGLNQPKSTATFQINAPSAGTYTLALGYLKEVSLHRQFVLIKTATKNYQVWFPASSGWSDTARVMVDVYLEEGENQLILTNPIRGQKEDSMMRYAKMGEALQQVQPAHKPIFYSICEHGRTEPWTWAASFAGSWRSTHDIHATWIGIMNCYEPTADLWKYQQPGSYNDPDMLEVGVGHLSDEEYLTHFVLWCMMSAPLILGMDVTKLKPEHLAIIKNKKLINMNQDPLMLQASRHHLEEDLDLLIKPLSDDQVAVCFFNKADGPNTSKTYDISHILSKDVRVQMTTGVPLDVENVLTEEKMQLGAAITIPPLSAHQVALYLIGGKNNE